MIAEDAVGGIILFQYGQPVRRSFGPFTVSIDPIWTDAGVMEHLVTIIAGFPPPPWVRRMSWRLELQDGVAGNVEFRPTEYRPGKGGQFRIALEEAKPAVSYVLRLRPATEVRCERLALYVRERALEDAVALFQEALEESGDTGRAPTAATPQQVVEGLLRNLPGPIWRSMPAEQQRFLLEAAGIAWLDRLTDVARKAATPAAARAYGGAARWSLDAAGGDPKGMLARSAAWEALAEQDSEAARAYTLAELAGRTPAELQVLLAITPGQVEAKLAEAQRVIDGEVVVRGTPAAAAVAPVLPTDTPNGGRPSAGTAVPPFLVISPARLQLKAGHVFLRPPPARKGRLLRFVPWAALAASILLVLAAYVWKRPAPQPEVGPTSANLAAAARLGTHKAFGDQLARLLKDSRQARVRPESPPRQIVEGDRRDCQSIIAFLETQPTPLTAAAKKALVDRCLGWVEGYGHLLADIDRADTPERLRELRRQADRDFEELLIFLGQFANQTFS